MPVNREFSRDHTRDETHITTQSQANFMARLEREAEDNSNAKPRTPKHDAKPTAKLYC